MKIVHLNIIAHMSEKVTGKDQIAKVAAISAGDEGPRGHINRIDVLGYLQTVVFHFVPDHIQTVAPCDHEQDKQKYDIRKSAVQGDIAVHKKDFIRNHIHGLGILYHLHGQASHEHKVTEYQHKIGKQYNNQGHSVYLNVWHPDNLLSMP